MRKKKLYTVRFYRKAWTDITVEATSKLDAFDKAEEKYNNGDYEDDDEDFENEYADIIEEEDIV